MQMKVEICFLARWWWSPSNCSFIRAFIFCLKLSEVSFYHQKTNKKRNNSHIIYKNTSIKSQFILSSFLKDCASDGGKLVGFPMQAALVFCFFRQGSSKVKSSASTSSFFTPSPACEDPSSAHLSL